MFSFQIEENLKLVLPMESDAETIYRVVRENLEELKRWMPWASDDYSIDTARAFVKTNLIELAKDGVFAAAVVFDEKIVGTIGFHNLNKENKSVQLGYWLDKNAQGKGLITKCCVALISFAFQNLRLNRIQINCNVENTKSRAVPERLGFKLEGVHRQVERLNDEFRDWAIYALLAADWKVLENK